MNTVYGIWIGKNMLFANSKRLSIVFLRENKNIISLTKNDDKLLSVTYAEIINDKYDFNICMLDTKGKTMVSSKKSESYINQHQSDSYEIVENNPELSLIYKTYDGKIYQGELAERIYINTSINNAKNSEMLSISKRLEMWSLGTHYEHDDKELKTQINTHNYSVVYNTSAINDYHYCRFGANGYNEKGYALLPLIAIQSKGVQMREDLTKYKSKYTPREEYFADDTCAFPEDGSWCWSLKSDDKDKIILNGCNLGEYIFSLPNENELYEVIR